jgi:hypothetical protein
MSEHKKSEFEREMDREIEKRLKIMEEPNYDLGKKFSKANWIGAITVIILSIVVTAIGAF